MHPVFKDEIAAVKKRFNLKNAYVFHGSAFLENGGATLLTGPCGIGKTTLLRKKGTRIIEDSAVLVGRTRENELVVIDTGLRAAHLRIAKVSKMIRKLLGYEGAFDNRNITEGRFARTHKIGRGINTVAIAIGRLITPDKRNRQFTPRAFRLSKMVLITHARDEFKPMEVSEEGVRHLESDETKKLFTKTEVRITTPFERRWVREVG